MLCRIITFFYAVNRKKRVRVYKYSHESVAMEFYNKYMGLQNTDASEFNYIFASEFGL